MRCTENRPTGPESGKSGEYLRLVKGCQQADCGENCKRVDWSRTERSERPGRWSTQACKRRRFQSRSRRCGCEAERSWCRSRNQVISSYFICLEPTRLWRGRFFYAPSPCLQKSAVHPILGGWVILVYIFEKKT
jgi:hypothetical protein